MITKKDVKNYLNEMMKIEKKMETYYENLDKQISDERFKKKFKKLMHEEQEHQSLVQELEDLLKHWEK